MLKLIQITHTPKWEEVRKNIIEYDIITQNP